MTYNWLDIVLICLMVAFIIEGVAQGFSRLLVGLIATVMGILIAAWCYGVAGGLLLPFVSSQAVANVVGFLIVFIGVQIVGALLGWAIARLFKWSGLSWLDRMLGAGFGALKAALVGICLVMILTAFPMKKLPEGLATSRLAPYYVEGAVIMIHAAPMELKAGFQATYEQLKKFWSENIPPNHRSSIETATI